MKIYTVETKILDALVVFYVGEEKTAIEILKKLCGVDFDLTGAGGFVLRLPIDGFPQHFLWIESKEMISLRHEVNHLTLQIFEGYGVDPTKEQEFFCYFNQYLIDEICKQLKINN
jgi:hypothetical protein